VQRASPSAVRGPVLAPPCILQRPFDIAGLRQGWRVHLQQASHRGAILAAANGEEWVSGV